MSKRDRDRKKTAKARKQRTEDNQLGRIAINELGNGRNQSHSFNDIEKERFPKLQVPTRFASEV